MNSAIDRQRIYYTVYEKKLSPSSPPFFRHIGSYSDIRDAVQAIVSTYRRRPDRIGQLAIESSTTKPKHWVYVTRYRD